MIARRLVSLLALACAALASDATDLLEGVNAIGVPGVPGPLVVCGEGAVPVVGAVAGGRPVPLVAAGRVGRGRVVVFGHTGYLTGTLTEADTLQLLLNAVEWCGGKRVAVRRLPKALELLRQKGVDAVAANGPEGCDVLIADAAGLDPEQVRRTIAFLRKGGGLVTAGLGWGWQQLNPAKDLASDHPGHVLLADAGIYFGDGAIDVPRDRRIPAGEAPPRVLNARDALDALARRGATEETELAVASLSRAAAGLPPFDTHLLPRLRKLAARRRDADALPSEKRPLRDASGLAKALLAFDLRHERDLEPGKVRAHPAATGFPGAVPKAARRVTREVRIEAATPGWHSTGLYAAPGETITLRVPTEAARLGWKLRIGAHSDRLWHLPEWRRAPDVVRVFPVTEEVTRAASAFGGLVYVEVPRADARFDVRIADAVEAPWFVLGSTDPAEWKRSLRKAPAPWAELATGKVILTLPSDVVRDLDDPTELMRFWDRVMDACADLAARPRERERPERYVADVQISAGYMHAGYPIMTHLDAAARFVDLEVLSTKGDWGMFHEMGHNHQSGDWTFGGTGEVTCNLFSIYILETVIGTKTLHGAIAPAERAKKKQKYLEGGADFARWKSDPFLALIPYVELREAFGWETYRKVFAEYRALPAEERPKTDAEKRDQWMVRFARAAGRDLGPFFEQWGIPVSAEARKSIAGLPPWNPG